MKAVELEEEFKPRFAQIDATEVFKHLHLGNTEKMERELRKIPEEERDEVKKLIEDYKSERFTSLRDVYQVFDKWLEFKDRKRIDVMLATALSNKAPELEPIWLILVGPCGDGKTEQVKALKDPLEDSDIPDEAETKRISEITQNTLVSGQAGESFDLAPKLEGKLILIYDFATILNLPSDAKRKVWSQLRELYDGQIGKQAGSGKDVDYTLDPAPSLIACSTPDIDNQLIKKDKLGTRELLYRTEQKTPEEIDNILDKVLENHESMKEMREELRSVVRDFLDRKEVNTELDVPKEIEEKLKAKAKRLSIMRAQGDFDRYSNELMRQVNMETPSRLVNQFKTIYTALLSLSPDYPPERALKVIDKIAASSGEQRREQVFQELKSCNETTVYQISQKLKVSRKMIDRDLQVLWNLDYVEKRTKETDNGETTLWSLSDKAEELIPERENPRSKILDTLDENGPIPYSEVLENTEADEQTAEKSINHLLDEGEIFEPEAGKLDKL